MPYSEAQKRATVKYRKENYDRIMLEIKRGAKDEWKGAAAGAGESLNGFIVKAVEERIARDQRGEA